jgi:hypothetical protein
VRVRVRGRAAPPCLDVEEVPLTLTLTLTMPGC